MKYLFVILSIASVLMMFSIGCSNPTEQELSIVGSIYIDSLPDNSVITASILYDDIYRSDTVITDYAFHNLSTIDRQPILKIYVNEEYQKSFSVEVNHLDTFRFTYIKEFRNDLNELKYVFCSKCLIWLGIDKVKPINEILDNITFKCPRCNTIVTYTY